ncbi:MAG: ferrous iron transport protein B [Flavobacteriales bacterium]
MNDRRIALTGNPNTGKSSIFNLLTGLNQQVGNFPGVTVDKKSGTFRLSNGEKCTVVDLPGTYSLFPRSSDERVVYQSLAEKKTHAIDAVVVVADISNLKRNLLLFTQIYDLGMPIVLALTMSDVLERRQLEIDLTPLRNAFPDVSVVLVNGRSGEGISGLRAEIEKMAEVSDRKLFGIRSPIFIANDEKAQTTDAIERYQKIKELSARIITKTGESQSKAFTHKIDKVLVHPIFGYAIFTFLLLLIFQVIFTIAAYPMDWIDGAFLQFSKWIQNMLPSGVFTDLLAEGIVPGIGGIAVFIPQIALLFFFLSILEETGYMARVVFIMDKLVRPFGLNGKSVVPLMSSAACAIPGIMATRTISSWKERLITIMVSPLMSCSARIPVYTLLIALVVPDQLILGFINLKGLVLFGLYALGLISALVVAFVMKFLIQAREASYLLLEMPAYKFPRWNQVFLTLWEKVRVFIVDAGKVILAISILLWALASYGPSERKSKALADLEKRTSELALTDAEKEAMKQAVELENSYIGIMGKAIEPAIAPLGFDWKIGISLITSFAAREVFVGSMATIYSVGEDFESDETLTDRLRNERNASGQPVYTLASGVSLMVFYVYAMQCMATLAVVKRETKSWKWPIIQLVYMGIMAYLASWFVFNILS